MQGSRSSYTRARILEVASRLFADKGHDNTSLREVTAEARVNLSSVNYHFGSKEGLVQAVYERQLDILDRERMLLLDALEAEAADGPVPPARIIDAFFRPLIHHAMRHATGNTPFLPRLQPPPPTNGSAQGAVVSDIHAATIERYRQALAKSLPDIPECELLWRLQFMLGAASSAIAGLDGLLFALKRESAKPLDADRLTDRLTAFLSYGLAAPLGPGSGNSPSQCAPPITAIPPDTVGAQPL
jgi:AcrR family transcriptional regulator